LRAERREFSNTKLNLFTAVNRERKTILFGTEKRHASEVKANIKKVPLGVTD
jgi:hypothetical protein